MSRNLSPITRVDLNVFHYVIGQDIRFERRTIGGVWLFTSFPLFNSDNERRNCQAYLEVSLSQHKHNTLLDHLNVRSFNIEQDADQRRMKYIHLAFMLHVISHLLSFGIVPITLTTSMQLAFIINLPLGRIWHIVRVTRVNRSPILPKNGK